MNIPVVERFLGRHLCKEIPELLPLAKELANIRYADRPKGVPVPEMPKEITERIIKTIAAHA